MDKKIFAIFLLGILLVTPLASAGFGEWVSGVFSTSESQRDDRIIGPGLPQLDDEGPIMVPEDPIPDSDGGGSGAVYAWNLNTHKILSEGEEIMFGMKGILELQGVDSAENACLIKIRMPGPDGDNAIAIAQVGELYVLSNELGELVFGVTALTQEPDYCSVVIRYDHFLETEPEQPIFEEEVPIIEPEDEDSSEGGQAHI